MFRYISKAYFHRNINPNTLSPNPMNTPPLKIAFRLLWLIGLALCFPLASWADEASPLRLDAAVRSGNAEWTGVGVINDSGAGQLASGSIRPGEKRSVTVRVARSGGADASATVRLSVPDWSAFAASNWSARFYEAASGADVTGAITSAGGWEIALDAGEERELRLEVTAPSPVALGATQTLSLRAEANPTSETPAVDLVRASWSGIAAKYRISGRTFRVAPDGQAVMLPGTFVQAVWLTNSDPNGRYEIGNFSPGTYRISANRPGFNFAPVDITLPVSPEAPDASVDLIGTSSDTQFYSIYGEAIGLDGQRQAGVSIYFNSGLQPVATTDANGQFAVHDLVGGKYGSYELRASWGGLEWAPDREQFGVGLPVTSGPRAPDGWVAFTAMGPDNNGPGNKFTEFPDGAIPPDTQYSIRGVADDLGGVAQILYRLQRTRAGVTEYYDWGPHLWITDANNPYLTLYDGNARGAHAQWFRGFNGMAAGHYTLTVWGRDNLGNETPPDKRSSISWDIGAPTPTQPLQIDASLRAAGAGTWRGQGLINATGRRSDPDPHHRGGRDQDPPNQT